MIAKTFSATNWGMEVIPVEVEVEISKGLPNFIIVGLPDQAVQESTERVRSALKNMGMAFPPGRIVINMAPADLRKKGPNLDLSVAIAILIHEGVISAKQVNGRLFIGELSLSGELRSVEGVLPIALSLPNHHVSEIIVPMANLEEARLARKVPSLGFNNLQEVVSFLKDGIPPEQIIDTIVDSDITTEIDFTDIKGQPLAKRVLEISGAGGHNTLLVGSPGSGKTLLCRAYPGILPILTEGESIEVSKIFSIAGYLKKGKLINIPPFRSPHHTISTIGLIGGGSIPKPGEITLSHRGVLFMDELTEFKREALEALRQPLESSTVTIARASGSLTYPSKFILLSAINPCPCGYYGDTIKDCRCSPGEIKKYRSKISGPILDRIDLHLEMPSLKIEELKETGNAEPSSEVRKRVEKARKIQRERYKDEKFSLNSELNPRTIKKYLDITREGKQLLEMGARRLGLTGRAYDKVIKVAMTIGNLNNSTTVRSEHIGEALTYRESTFYE